MSHSKRESDKRLSELSLYCKKLESRLSSKPKSFVAGERSVGAEKKVATLEVERERGNALMIMIRTTHSFPPPPRKKFKKEKSSLKI